MKIGMMGGWNTNSGSSFHAELIGKEWIESGHKLEIFTFYDYAFHGTAITAIDEPYVTRCFTVSSYIPPKLDPIPFLTSECEVFVTQDLGMLPKNELGKIFKRIKKRSKCVTVIHDGNLSKNPDFYQFEWDSVVCFDKRYKEFLEPVYGDKTCIIPYPCLPWNPGNKGNARRKLDLPIDKKIIFSFGPAAKHIIDIIPDIAELGKKYPLLLLIVSKEKDIVNFLKSCLPVIPIPVKIIEEIPDTNKLYDYLYAADALIFNKPSASQVVVSSTAFQCLGSGCPMITRNSNFAEYFDKEVMKFSDTDELKHQLISVFEEKEEYKKTLESARLYVNENSYKEIGRKFIELFKNL
ncbi:MAG: hypothetical protein PHE49_10445 [bacterium]|nr:hypothetical protein [bacterium]